MTPGKQDIRRLLGPIDDHLVAEIEAAGATMAELEEVAAHLAQETDVAAEMRRTLSGRALEIYRLLQSREALWDEDR